MNASQERRGHPHAMEEAVDDFIRRVSLLTRDDALRVIWAYCQYLQLPDFELPEAIEAEEFRKREFKLDWISPWELETLSREILIYARDRGLARRTLKRWSNMSTLVNSLKRLENEIYGRYGSQDNVLIEVGRIAHRQFPWQGNPPNSSATARYYAIFNTDEINAIARDKLGLSIDEIYFCGTAFLGSLLSAPAVRLPLKSDIKALPVETFDRFVAWCAKDVTGMRAMLREETKHDDTFAYSYNSLRCWPLITTTDEMGTIALCPLPTLLFWRYTSGLYYDLIRDPRFSNALGASFQTYIGEVLNRSSRTGRLKVLAEQPYGAPRARKQSVDWIVYDGQDAAFVECKAKRMTWGAKAALTDLSAPTRDMEDLASSVVQVYKTLRDYLNNQYPHFRYRGECGIYPMVVTLENWRLFGPRLMSMLNSAVSKQMERAGLPKELMTTFPYSLAASDEAEAIFQIADSMGIAKFLDGKCRNPEMAGWEWSGYARTVIEPGFEFKNLFEREYEAAFSSLLRLEPSNGSIV